MLKAKRLARIIEILRAEGFLTLSDIAGQLGTSVSTVRRDIEHLSRIAPITRTHGGAVLNPGETLSFEPGTSLSLEIESDAKRMIGRHGAALIAPGQAVMFDSGTTTAEVARAAAARDIPFTAFTNDITIAAVLSASERIATHVFHGRVRPGSATLLGADTVADIARIRADLLFFGTHAGSPEGLSDTSTELASVKRAFLDAADIRILVADRTKFPKRSLCRFAGLDEADRIITDEGIDADLLAELSRATNRIEIARKETP
ncbi:MAG: DeoR/GlpR family DNA-binding transcription regulator [Tropicimonas sp.]|uniref:DeoR/GlpR family DNA-binding transcription regulator n=1 Tax=Tropicimonas sp. TaxID=2067044 RepID=UPI003A8B5E1C